MTQLPGRLKVWIDARAVSPLSRPRSDGAQARLEPDDARQARQPRAGTLKGASTGVHLAPARETLRQARSGLVPGCIPFRYASRQIPRFRSDQEECDFWTRHSVEEFAEDLQDLEVAIRPLRTEQIAVRLYKEDLQ